MALLLGNLSLEVETYIFMSIYLFIIYHNLL